VLTVAQSVQRVQYYLHVVTSSYKEALVYLGLDTTTLFRSELTHDCSVMDMLNHTTGTIDGAEFLSVFFKVMVQYIEHVYIQSQHRHACSSRSVIVQTTCTGSLLLVLLRTLPCRTVFDTE
jgi:hypothetical protein